MKLYCYPEALSWLLNGNTSTFDCDGIRVGLGGQGKPKPYYAAFKSVAHEFF